jgi:hypothetical protein
MLIIKLGDTHSYKIVYIDDFHAFVNDCKMLIINGRPY